VILCSRSVIFLLVLNRLFMIMLGFSLVCSSIRWMVVLGLVLIMIMWLCSACICFSDVIVFGSGVECGMLSVG